MMNYIVFFWFKSFSSTLLNFNCSVLFFPLVMNDSLNDVPWVTVKCGFCCALCFYIDTSVIKYVNT